MSSSQRCCKNHPDSFCYICGEFVMGKQKRHITDFVKSTYEAYFDMRLGDQGKWALHIVCKTCVETLCSWTNGLLKL